MGPSSFLIVGFGSIGQRHLANLKKIQPDSTVILLRRKGSQGIAEDIKGVDHVIHNISDIGRFDIKAAILSNPAPFHIDVARALLRDDVHLLVEKPISDSLHGVTELINEANHKNISLLTGYNFRFSESAQQFKNIIDDNLIGKTLQVLVDTGQYLPDWRVGVDYREGVSARRKLGGGVLLELSHEFDYLRWFFGEVKGLYAECQKTGTLDVDVEDNVNILINFENGISAVVHMDFLQRKPNRVCKVIGTEGLVSWDAISGEISLDLIDEKKVGLSQDDVAITASRNDMYEAEMRHFIDCVDAGAIPRVTGVDGLEALKIALAARESAMSGRYVEIREQFGNG